MKIKHLFFLLLIYFFSFSFAEAGFGVSPGQIIEDKLVPGSHFETTIYLVQGNPTEDLPVELTVESENIKDWITFEQDGKFTIPAGVQQFPVKITFDVPSDASLNIYKAFLRINTIPDAATRDGQIAISIGGRIDVHLTVGDDVIKEYEILSLIIKDIKENKDPTVEVKVKNTGNVSAKPYAATFELFDRFGNVRLGYAEFDNFEEVKSFSEATQDISFPIDVKFAPGEYWGHVKIYNESQQLIKELRTVFNVTEAKWYENLLQYVWIAGVVVGGLILLFILFIIIKRIKNKKKLDFQSRVNSKAQKLKY